MTIRLILILFKRSILQLSGTVRTNEMFDMVLSTHGSYTTTTRIQISRMENDEVKQQTRLVFDTRNKAIHAVDGSAIHIVADDRARRMNPSEKVVNIPKHFTPTKITNSPPIYLTNKTSLMIMTTQCLNVRINDNLFTPKTFRYEIIHITFSEDKQSIFQYALEIKSYRQ